MAMENVIKTVTYEPWANALLQEAGAFVLGCFNRRPDSRLVFHNFQLAERMAQTVAEIFHNDRLNPETAAAAALAAWFLPVGYLHDYQNPLQYSLKEIGQFFMRHQCPEEWRIRVVQSLQTVGNQQTPVTLEAQLLHDAHQIAAFIRDGDQRLPLLRLEWQLMDKRQLDKSDWLRLQLQMLLQIRLYSRHAKLVYEPALSLLLLKAQQAVEKGQQREESEPAVSGKFQYLESEGPLRAAQTFFRANYRNHINLSAIADNKANIMISVNSILISVLITFLSYRNIAEVKPMVLLPVVIFLVTGLTSLVFAVLSARPKVTALNNRQMPKAQVVRNIVFFGNFVSLDLEEYEEAMDEMFRNSELLYGNMTRDLYHLGKVLDKKYRYLTVSYNVFMAGFIATVSTFLLVLFT